MILVSYKIVWILAQTRLLLLPRKMVKETISQMKNLLETMKTSKSIISKK